MKQPHIILLLGLYILWASCNETASKQAIPVVAKPFDSNVLAVKSSLYKAVRGQVLYLPVYSSLPHFTEDSEYTADMSALVAIHNTDLEHSITVSQVLYFNTEGKLVDDFLKKSPRVVAPLSTIVYHVPYEDKSGVGANFLIEWQADTLVNEPLIESITKKLITNQSAAFISQGKIIREDLGLK